MKCPSILEYKGLQLFQKQVKKATQNAIHDFTKQQWLGRILEYESHSTRQLED